MDEILIRSYLETTYTTFNPKMEMVVGNINNELNIYLKEIHQTHWSFITAENPRSQSLSVKVNAIRNSILESYLIKNNLHYLKGVGIPKDKNWIPEKSFLIFGLNKKEAQQMAITYDQNAFVCGEINKAAELVCGYL
jgi:hypothetical protein